MGMPREAPESDPLAAAGHWVARRPSTKSRTSRKVANVTGDGRGGSLVSATPRSQVTTVARCPRRPWSHASHKIAGPALSSSAMLGCAPVNARRTLSTVTGPASSENGATSDQQDNGQRHEPDEVPPVLCAAAADRSPAWSPTWLTTPHFRQSMRYDAARTPSRCGVSDDGEDDDARGGDADEPEDM